jgi:murein DD-endopeptidase MepM/ murein hydrolase activator NlpD
MFTRFEGEKPKVDVDLSLKAIGSSGKISGNVSDKKSGIKKIWIALSRDGKDYVVYENEFKTKFFSRKGWVHEFPVNVTIEPKRLGLSDGPVLLKIRVNDCALRGWFSGNVTYIEKNVAIDSQPPSIDVLTKSHNLVPGGAGLIIYKVSEPVERTGVRVGDNFFPGYSGYFKDSNIFLAFFALDHTQGPGTTLSLEASDLAGNITKTNFVHYIANKTFKSDTINITDSFLDSTLSGFSADGYPGDPGDKLKKFLWINNELRKMNGDRIMSMGPFTDRELYWSRPFLRLPASAPRANYADHRSYMYNGKKIDEQYHLGVDLASLQQADVPAANKGKVVMAENIGIYGNTIVIDHGFGLFSTYSHLSRFRVKVGDMVEKGTIIANTGQTGLAGGDHLHFGMFVHNVFVNPIQWWDPSWIENNISSKIKDIQSQYSK